MHCLLSTLCPRSGGYHGACPHGAAVPELAAGSRLPEPRPGLWQTGNTESRIFNGALCGLSQGRVCSPKSRCELNELTF